MNLNQIYKKRNSKNCPDRCGKLLEWDTEKKVYFDPDTNLKRHLQPNFYTALPLLEENKLTDAFLDFVNTFNTCLKTQQMKIQYTGKSKKYTSKILLIFNYLCALLLCVSITIFCIDSQFYEGNKLKLLSKILFYLVLPLLLYINQYKKMNNNIIILNNKKRRKVPLYVFVPEELATRLRRFIALKHQTTEKGLLSFEVEQAIRNHLATQNTQQQSTQIGRSSPQNQIIKVKKVMADIQQYWIDSGLYVEIPQYILEKHLDQAIANLRGIDKRTIKTWKQYLEQHGYIRKTGLHQYEILKS